MEITLEVVVQAILAGAALWYAWETRGLNQKAAEQIGVSRRQMRLRMAPSIQAMIEPAPSGETLDERMEAYEEHQGEPFSEQERDQIREALEETRYGVRVRNVSDRVPRGISAAVYDADNRHFLATYRAELIKQAESRVLVTRPKPLNQEEIRDWLRSSYDEAAGPQIQSHLEHNDTSYFLVFYEDVEGNMYTYGQEYEIAENGKALYPSRSRLLMEV